jgi:hypothetical protein
MFRRQAQPCYPEPSRPDGCFPDNARTRSPFSCWISGELDRLTGAGDAPPAGRRPSRPARSRRRPDRDR